MYMCVSLGGEGCIGDALLCLLSFFTCFLHGALFRKCQDPSGCNTWHEGQSRSRSCGACGKEGRVEQDVGYGGR